ncbi:MAG: TonB-dependent receptor [Candidatus Neomarinimicrobiota bacterium]
MKYVQKILKFSFLLILVVQFVSAGTTGKISGKVVDEKNQPLIGCNIIIKNTSLGAATNLEGEYFIINIPPGSYDISASMIGYSTVTIEGTQVMVDLTAKADFFLNPESIEGEEIIVTAEKPTVRLDQTSMSAVVSSEDIENLPVTEVGDIIELQAGIVRDPNGGFHVRGGRSSEVSFWVDGVATTDSYDGSSGLEIENAGIQEVQIISGTFNAEYGQAMSGIVNVVTKDGGENYEGNLEIYSGGYQTNHSDIYSISSPFSQWQSFSDLNNDGNWDYGEILYDLNNNGTWDEGEIYWDRNGNQSWDGDEGSEPLNDDLGYDGYLGDYYDYNGDGKTTQPSPGEGNGRKDWGEHEFSQDKNGYTKYLNIFENTFQQSNLSGSLSGPIPFSKSRLTFYSTFRYYQSSGRYYGRKLFTPTGSFGNESIVPLSPFSKLSGQLKLTYKIKSGMKASYTSYLTEKSYKNYDSYFKYNPDGVLNNYESDQSHMLSLTHSISQNTFYEVKYIDFSSGYRQSLFDPSNVPYSTNVVSENGLESYDLRDSISIRTGYDIFQDIPRYSITMLEDGSYEVVDFSDQTGYVANDQFITPAWSFGIGGTQNGRFSRNTSFKQFKFDLSSQINPTHFIKTGILFKVYDMWADDKFLNYKTVGEWSVTQNGDTLGYNPLAGARMNPFTPIINPSYTSEHDYFRVQPKEISLFLQDKIELDELIINAGVRFDYFDPDWKIPKNDRLPGNLKYYLAATESDTSVFWENEFSSMHNGVVILDSLNEQGAVALENLFTTGVEFDSTIQTYTEAFEEQLSSYRETFRWEYGYNKVKPSFQLSPRIGIAYPITDRGVIHVSYGHFFQVPNFSFLYENPEFEITNNNNGGILGNADLKPEKTVMYEIGFKQEIAYRTAIDLTVFYRDTRDWVGVSTTIKKYPVGNYRKYENKDYANTRGFTLVLDRQFSGGFGGGIDYTWMIAEGTYSNPQDAYFDAQDNQAPRLSMLPLNWDQTHTLNLRATLGGKNWIVSSIGKIWTGKPYTPEFKTGSISGAGAFAGFADNSERKPNIFDLDLRASYSLSLLGLNSKIYCNIYNLLDIRNEFSVWNDTGRSTYTLTAKDVPLTDSGRIGHLNEHLLRPEWFGDPRRINIGLNVSL